MPSRFEGLPFVATEAMRAGLAVFASDVGGNSELVMDSYTGRIFEPEDIEGIVRIVRSTPRVMLLEYGERGRTRFLDRFTAKAMNRGLLNEYNQVVGRVEQKIDGEDAVLRVLSMRSYAKQI